MVDQERWARAMSGARYHEAGHAVAAYHQGWQVVGVTATDETWYTHYRCPMFGGSEHWRAACVTLAGWYADMLHGWGEIRIDSWWQFLHEALTERQLADEGDEDALGDSSQLLDHVEAMAQEWPYESRENCYREVVEDTRELVLEYWHEVEAVAKALEERDGYLDGETLHEMLDGEEKG
jgi:hypothetical protein